MFIIRLIKKMVAFIGIIPLLVISMLCTVIEKVGSFVVGIAIFLLAILSIQALVRTDWISLVIFVITLALMLVLLFTVATIHGKIVYVISLLKEIIAR